MNAPQAMTHTVLDKALRRLADVVVSEVQIELTLIGSAAGILGSELPANRTTIDCDIAKLKPDPTGMVAVAEAAKIVSEEFELPANWLNDESVILGGLPEGWMSRRRLQLETDALAIYFISRLDLIAMKVHAHRPQDRQDIAELATPPTPEELCFARQHLDALTQDGSYDQKEIELAYAYLDALEENNDA